MSFQTIDDFFAAIGGDCYVQGLSRCHGSVRFDIIRPGGTDSWRVDIAKGDITVTRDDSPADAVVRADKALIDGIVRGDVNPVAATLRGVMAVEGNWDLLLLCQRLFSDPSLRPGGELVESQTK